MFSHPDIKESRKNKFVKEPTLSFSFTDFDKARASENTELLEKQLQELLVFLGKADSASAFVNGELDGAEK